MLKLLVDLSKQELEAGFLQFALSTASSTRKIGQRLFEALLMEQKVGLREVGLTAHAGRHRVATHLLEGIFSIVEPAGLHIAAGKPLAGFGHNIRLGGIETGDIGKRGGGFEEIAFFKL